MNPLTNMKNVIKLSEQELHSSSKSSWHDQYRDSAWIFIGGLPFDLTEGDIICIFSQYGEVVNINLIRAKDTGKSKGFCFLCYEDQRSTVLAVDNLNGIKILNRSIRVDHVNEYKIPKEHKKTDEETKKLYQEGCAPKAQPLSAPKIRTPPYDFRETIADQIQADIKLPPRLPIQPIKQEESTEKVKVKKEKKKSKKKKSKKKKSKKQSSSDSDSSSSEDSADERKKKNSDMDEKKSSSSRNKSSNDDEREDRSDSRRKEYKERIRSRSNERRVPDKRKERQRSRSDSYERRKQSSKSSRRSDGDRRHKR